MPYLILVIGLIIGLIALFRFFASANVDQIKAAFLTAAFVVVCTALFFLAVTGRLPAALALLAALAPVVLGFYSGGQKPPQPNGSSPNVASEKEALEILGLKPGATKAQIEKAYKKLMQKVHPDNEGSDWMAAKLNQARDLLLKDNP